MLNNLNPDVLSLSSKIRSNTSLTCHFETYVPYHITVGKSQFIFFFNRVFLCPSAGLILAQYKNVELDCLERAAESLVEPLIAHNMTQKWAG